MKEALRLVLEDKTTERILDALGQRLVFAGGLTAGAVSVLACALREATGREILLVTPHIDLADDLIENVSIFNDSAAILEPSGAALSFDQGFDPQALGSRIALIERYIPGGSRPAIVVASAASMVEGLPEPDALYSGVFDVSSGARLDMQRLLEWLVDQRFSREYEAAEPWQFAVRGGIVDVFQPGAAAPVRIEFAGDEVTSIRGIDPLTGRGVKQLPTFRIVTPRAAAARENLTPFTRYLAPDAVAVVWEPPDVEQAALAHLERQKSLGGVVDFAALWKSLESMTLVQASAFQFSQARAIAFESRAFSIAAQDVESIVAEFLEFASHMDRTIVFALNDAEKSRLEGLFAPKSPGRALPFETVVGRFNRSFYFADRRLAFVGHQDLFHRYRMRRRLRPAVQSRPVTTLVELSPGDYVVHADHGIARFRGTQLIEKDNRRREYLALEFAGRTRLLVPVSHLDLVSRYVGPTDRPPALNAIGSKSWQARKARVARAVRDLAAELLRLQAVRVTKEGIHYDVDQAAQGEFEEEFIYEETEDQLKSLADIKKDLFSPRPMDRLLCGDVGFGKTELAIRAAFIAVSAGKQVAVLVPTTILAEQHYRTFSERMADYPVLIEVLSRLRSKRDQRETIERLRRKQVDVVIGTHRLIQRDVIFADLALVIIDEEQRFGVEHKERLKRLRETVDVLTLTATPIPRTLHMALVGLRDISVLETPPQDRQAIGTFVGALSRERLREVVLRELDREGQVYFVHNRVQSIENAAARVADAVPECSIAVAHGQMNEQLLAQRMLDFIAGKYDVLVATTIIESGLDIPNVNTIVIDDADRYGLADLHQLRGRVGRYKHRAHAYFLLPEGRPITPEGRKRLEAIEHFSELGAGFRIAMRDMEIRGVGNVLGKEQSGHVAAVGYELYCRLLSEAVASLKGQPPSQIPEAHVELGAGSHLPENYVESPSHRLDVYKRLSTAVSTDEVDDIRREMADRFGPPPPAADEFILAARLRILAHRDHIRMILAHKGRLVIQAADIKAAASLFEGDDRTVRIADERTAHVIFKRGLPPAGQLVRLVTNILQGNLLRV